MAAKVEEIVAKSSNKISSKLYIQDCKELWAPGRYTTKLVIHSNNLGKYRAILTRLCSVLI